MSELPEPLPARNPHHRVSPGDVRAFLVGVQPGWYTSKALLPRYNAWADREGCPRASVKALGEAIKRALNPDSGYAHGHISVWNITAEMVSGPTS